VVRTRHVSTAVNRSVSTRWLYQRATRHIVTTGEALRQQLHRDNGYALQSMTSVPTGIDLNRFKPLSRDECRAALGLTANSNLIGIVATLRDWKGHGYLFEAMAKLAARYPQWQLLVIGDGPYEPALRAKVASLGLENRVQFVGRQQNIPEWLNALDLFVLPSYGDEGVPQAIIQAMACGLPVISTPIGSIPEAVIDKVTGILVTPRDSTALVRAIENLITHPELRSQFGEAGQTHAREKFTLDQMLNRMETVFNKVVEAN
jgi:glycosyltransferase involved in cell wall biosynthesis